MTDNIINLAKVKEIRERNKVVEKPIVFNLEDEVEKDIKNLGESVNLDREGSVELATSFYKKYPALMEFIREELLY